MNPFLILAAIVLFVLLLLRADRRLTPDQRFELDGALKGIGGPQTSGWANAFCIAFAPWVGHHTKAWRRILNACLASSGLYLYFSLVLWATSGFATASLIYLGFVWLVFGISIGWPKDALVMSQVRRLALLTDAVQTWAPSASVQLSPWLLRCLRLGGHLLTLIALAVFAFMCVVGLHIAVTQGYELAAWHIPIVDVRDRLIDTWGRQDVWGVDGTVPATRAGHQLLLGITFIPLAFFYLFGLCYFWIGAIIRLYYRIRRRVPQASATARPLLKTALAGLPLALVLTIPMIVLSPAILIAVVLAFALGPLREKSRNAAPAPA